MGLSNLKCIKYVKTSVDLQVEKINAAATATGPNSTEVTSMDKLVNIRSPIRTKK